MFSKLKKIKYTCKHKIAFLKVEKELLGRNTLSGIFHDVDKVLLCLIPFLPLETISKIHNRTSRHHLPNAIQKEKYMVQSVIDWECARYTKPDKPLNAFDTLINYYSQYYNDFFPVMKKLNLLPANILNPPLILEGADLIGKSTIISHLSTHYGFSNTQDRCIEIYSNILFDIDKKTALHNICEKLKKRDCFLVVLYTSDADLLRTRMDQRQKHQILDEFDAMAVEYNTLYIDTFESISFPNCVMLNIDGKSCDAICDEILAEYIVKIL